MAGVVVRADILEDKDGKSRGIGTVTFEQAIEAVQAICILGSQLGRGGGCTASRAGLGAAQPAGHREHCIPGEGIARARKVRL